MNIFFKKDISTFFPQNTLSTFIIILFFFFSRILQLEEEFIQRVCSDIIALKPDVVFTEKGVSGETVVDIICKVSIFFSFECMVYIMLLRWCQWTHTFYAMVFEFLTKCIIIVLWTII